MAGQGADPRLGVRATARRGRPRARLWRTARRGGGGQAARGSGWCIPHRPSGMPRRRRRRRRHVRTARLRGGGGKCGPAAPVGADEGSLLVCRHRSCAAIRLLTAPPPGSRRCRDSARLSGLAGRPRMRRSPARGGSHCPGSRRPSPRAIPPAAAARQRRDTRETIGLPLRGRTGPSAHPDPLATASEGGGPGPACGKP
jgi:hypothetical protein